MGEFLSAGVPIEGVNPWWITGLTDGEGCFYTSLRSRSGTQAFLGKTGTRYEGFEFSPRFSIRLRADDAATLDRIYRFFGVGHVVFNKALGVSRRGQSGSSPNPTLEYRCSVLDDLLDVIVPHFERFPLQSKKHKDFVIWRKTLSLYREIDAAHNRGWWRKRPEQFGALAGYVVALREVREFNHAMAGA